MKRFTASSSSSSSSSSYIIIIIIPLSSFIHSGHFYSAPSSPLLLRGAPDYSADTVSEFHAEVHRQLQLKVIVSTKVPPRPTYKSTTLLFNLFNINKTRM